jgi:hypothetical protein
MESPSSVKGGKGTMKKLGLLTVAATLALGMATPSYANDIVNSGVSLAGSATATIIDTPQAMVVDSLWHMPLKMWHGLAEKFGDEKGFQQNVVGAMIGIPAGIVWGIPTGALRGAKHGMGVGWEKPFSTESFLVIHDED